MKSRRVGFAVRAVLAAGWCLPWMPGLAHAREGARGEESEPSACLLARQVEDGSVVLLDFASNRIQARIAHSAERLDDAVVAPDGARVALLSRDGTVAIHGAVDGVLLARLQTAAPGEGQRWAQRTVAFALDGARLVVACGNQPTELWDLELEQRVAELTLQVDVPVRRLALSRDRRWLAIGDERGNVGVFDARDGAQRGERAKVPGGVSALAFDPDAKLLAIGSEDCRARIFQIETGAVLRELSHCDQDVFGDMAIGDVRFSPDGRTLVTTSYSYWEARAWDLFSGKQLWSHDYGGGSPDLPSATFSPDGELVLLTVNGVVLDARKGSVRHVLAPDGGALNAWVFTDGRFAWQREDDRLQVHAVASGELLFERDLAAEEVAPSHE